MGMKWMAAAALLAMAGGCVNAHTTLAAAPAVQPAEGAVHVRAIRLPAADPEAAAALYKRAFGMHEIRRINGQGFIEIVLNSGPTIDDAKASQRAPIVIMTKPKDLQIGTLAYLILNVADLALAIRQAETAGFELARAPAVAASGAGYAFLRDPDGNQVELLRSP